MAKLIKKNYRLLLLLLLSFGVYSYRLQQSIVLHSDLGRDLYQIEKIVQGKLTLVGPKLSFGGLYLGPYYYYLFVPVYYLFGRQLTSIHYFNLLLFVLAVGYSAGYFLRKFGYGDGMIVSLSIIFLPLMIISSRSPSNPTSFIPLLLILLTDIYANQQQSWWRLGLWGLVFGIIVNFHFINLVLLPSLLMSVYYYLKEKRRIWFLLGGVIISFLPLFLFELKHQFVIFTNTVIHQSFRSWLSATSVSSSLQGEKNILNNWWFISRQMRRLIGINPLLIYGLLLGLIIWFPRLVSNRRLVVNSLVSWGLAAIGLRFQFIPAYVYGLAVYLFVNFLFLVSAIKNWRLRRAIFFAVLLIQLVSFPRFAYSPSHRPPETIARAVRFVIDKQLVEKQGFNLIQISPSNPGATVGFEYRYFFLKNGYQPDSEFTYSQSKRLIIFSDDPDVNLIKFHSWETRQFGDQYFSRAKKYQIGGLDIYSVNKQ